MTTLYYHDGACSLAPHILLEWIGAPYKAEPIEFGSDKIKALNPAGSVPILQEDDGWVLTQAGAILAYLAAKNPEAGLRGDETPRGTAELDRWSAFFSSDMHASFWPVFGPQRFTTLDTDEARNAAKEAGLEMVRKRLKLVDQHLEGREWIVGEGKGKRSFVDAYSYPMFRWAAAKLPGGLADFPNVKAHFDRMSADEGVKAVLAAEKKGA